MKTSYFESISGNKSSSRMIGFIIVVVALIESNVVLYFGRDNVILAAAAAGTIFITIAVPAMAFLFFQKQTEVKQEKNYSRKKKVE
jgi:hypothetical protein